MKCEEGEKLNESNGMRWTQICKRAEGKQKKRRKREKRRKRRVKREVKKVAKR